MLAWLTLGKQAAVADYVIPGALGLLAGVLTAILRYIYNLVRAPAEIHAEQLTAIGTLERESQEQIVTLEEQIRALKDLPDPLRLSFVPGEPPYEDRHRVMIGIRLGGLREGMEFPHESTTFTFRGRVENTSLADVHNVAVRLSFEPARPRMSNLPLRLRDDHPPEGERHPRTFTIPAFDYKDVDVIRYNTPNEHAYICHTEDRVESTLPHGEYNVVITVHGNGVRPKEARFFINVMPQDVQFREHVA